MTAISISTAAFAGVVWLARRYGWGWLAPMTIYAGIWAAAIALYSLRLFPFDELAGSTWLMLVIGWFGFVGGGFAGGHAARRRGAPVVGVPLDDQALVWVMRAFFLIGLSGWMLFVWRVQQVEGMSAFFDAPIAVHRALTQRRIATSYLFLYYFGSVATILFGYRWLVLRRRPGTVDTVLQGLFVTAMAVSTERNQFLWCFASWVFLWLAPPVGDRGPGRVLTMAAAGALAGVVFYLGVGDWLGKSPSNIQWALRVEAARAGVAEPDLRPPGTPAEAAKVVLPADVEARLAYLLPGGPLYRVSVLYMAVAAALPSLDKGAREHPPTRGALTLRPIFRAFVRLGLIRDTLSGATYDEVRTPYPSNAYTYLYEYYRDFGWPGILLLPACCGLLAGFAYQRSAILPASVWPVLLSQLQAMTLWTPFQNRFVLTVSWYLVAGLLVAFLAAHLGARRRGATARG